MPSLAFSTERDGAGVARERDDAGPVAAVTRVRTSLAIADSRARSSGETLAEVSASTATATLVWYTWMRGPASASMMQKNVAAFSPSARWRAVSRHSQAAHATGRSSAQENPGMIEAHRAHSRGFRFPYRHGFGSHHAPAEAAVQEPLDDQAERSGKRQPGPEVGGRIENLRELGYAHVRIGRRRPFGLPKFRQRERVDELAVSGRNFDGSWIAREEIKRALFAP